MPRALVPLAPGCEDLEAVTIVDVLRRAGVEVVTAGLEGRGVRGARGTAFTADAELGEALDRDWDLVALPGGQPGTDRLRADPRLRELLQRQARRGALLGAVCAAPLVLAEAGLLQGRRATCYPGTFGAAGAAPFGALLVEAPVAVDGRIVTGRSAGAAMDFALRLVEELLGEGRRREVEERLVRG